MFWFTNKVGFGAIRASIGMAHRRASVSTGEANTVGDRGEAAGTAVQSRRGTDSPLWLPNWRRRAVVSMPGTPVRVVTQGQRDEPSSSKNSDIPSNPLLKATNVEKNKMCQSRKETHRKLSAWSARKKLSKAQTKWMARTLSTVKAHGLAS